MMKDAILRAVTEIRDIKQTLRKALMEEKQKTKVLIGRNFDLKKKLESLTEKYTDLMFEKYPDVTKEELDRKITEEEKLELPFS